MKKLFYLGMILFIGGAFLIANFQLKLTGNVISETTASVGSFLGLVFFVVGIGLMFAGREETETSSERDLVNLLRSSHFERAVRKHRGEARAIENALKKAGTGLGKEEKVVRADDLYSIRVNTIGRVILKKIGNKYVALDYLDNHQYDRMDPRVYDKISG